MVGQTNPEMTLPAGLACSEMDSPLVSCMVGFHSQTLSVIGIFVRNQAAWQGSAIKHEWPTRE
jgi:hypothetical protein